MRFSVSPLSLGTNGLAALNLILQRACVAVILMACSLNCASPIVQSAERVLIFSDQSAGVLPYDHAIRRSLECDAIEFTYLSNTEDLNDAMTEHPWTEVVGLFQHATPEPQAVQVLRGYLNNHPSTPIELFVWKADETTLSADVAAIATSALVIWRNGRTTVAYSCTPTQEAAEAATTPGAHFPSFDGIELIVPVAVGQVQQPIAPNSAAVIQWTPCELQALDAFIDDRIKCMADLDEHNKLCRELYGVGEGDETPAATQPADVVKLIECEEKADTNFKNCKRAALDRFLLRAEKCKKQSQTQQE